MEGFEFIPDGFVVTTSHDSSTDTFAHVVQYDDIALISVTWRSDGQYVLTIVTRSKHDVAVKRELCQAMELRKQLLAKFLEYKRRPRKTPVLERLAQAHEALAGHAACFMNEIEIVPGIPGREAEAAVDRCNKKRAREEGKEE